MADEKDNKKDRQTDTKPEPKASPPPPRPVRLEVTSSGKDGEYTFDLQVISDQGQGIKAEILVLEGDHKRTRVTTNESGYANYRATPFTDEEQEFFFRVLGTDIDDEITLDGPRPKAKPVKKIQPIPGGFWANVKHYIAEKQRTKGK